MAYKQLVSFRLDKTVTDKFQKLYPYCLSQFLRKAIYMAIKNPQIFRDIYFTEI